MRPSRSKMATVMDQEWIEQFQHQLPLSVGDELQAVLSSFSDTDDSFYVVPMNENTWAIDRAMSEVQQEHVSHSSAIPHLQTKTYAFVPC